MDTVYTPAQQLVTSFKRKLDLPGAKLSRQLYPTRSLQKMSKMESRNDHTSDRPGQKVGLESVINYQSGQSLTSKKKEEVQKRKEGRQKSHSLSSNHKSKSLLFVSRRVICEAVVSDLQSPWLHHPNLCQPERLFISS